MLGRAQFDSGDFGRPLITELRRYAMMKSLKKWALIVASGACLLQLGGCLPFGGAGAWVLLSYLNEEFFG